MTIIEIGNAVRERRISLRMRQEDLSELSGIGIKTIHLIETGKANPSINTLERLLEILGLTVTLKVKKIE